LLKAISTLSTLIAWRFVPRLATTSLLTMLAMAQMPVAYVRCPLVRLASLSFSTINPRPNTGRGILQETIMAGLSFSKDIKIVGILDVLTTAASATRTSKVIDTLGFNGCCIVFHNGTMTAGSDTTLKVSRANAASDADTLTGPGDILGTSQAITATDDDKIYYIDIAVMDDTERYLQLTATKDASNVSDESAVAYLYNGSESPVTHGTGSGTSGGTGAVGGEFFTVTTEGTA
jgi:hypothetical protein